MEEINISGAVPTGASAEFEVIRAPEPEPVPEGTQEPPPQAVIDSVAKAQEIMEATEPKWEAKEIPAEVTLSDGSIIRLKPPGELLAKDSKPALRALSFGGIVDFIDALAPRVITAWSLQDSNGRPLKPPAVDPQAMDNMTALQWQEIARWLALYKDHVDPPTRSNPTDA